MNVQRYARIAGVLFLVSLVAGGFGEAYAPSKLIVSGDATATAANIRNFDFLYVCVRPFGLRHQKTSRTLTASKTRFLWVFSAVKQTLSVRVSTRDTLRNASRALLLSRQSSLGSS